jgi:hypothetical protein
VVVQSVAFSHKKSVPITSMMMRCDEPVEVVVGLEERRVGIITNLARSSCGSCCKDLVSAENAELLLSDGGGVQAEVVVEEPVVTDCPCFG